MFSKLCGTWDRPALPHLGSCGLPSGSLLYITYMYICTLLYSKHFCLPRQVRKSYSFLDSVLPGSNSYIFLSIPWYCWWFKNPGYITTSLGLLVANSYPFMACVSATCRGPFSPMSRPSGKFPAAMAIAGCVADGHITFDTKAHVTSVECQLEVIVFFYPCQGHDIVMWLHWWSTFQGTYPTLGKGKSFWNWTNLNGWTPCNIFGIRDFFWHHFCSTSMF